MKPTDVGSPRRSLSISKSCLVIPWYTVPQHDVWKLFETHGRIGVARRASLKRFINTGVRLEEPVIGFLDELAEKEERHRSYLINRIVREYAERSGTPIPVAAADEPTKRSTKASRT